MPTQKFFEFYGGERASGLLLFIMLFSPREEFDGDILTNIRLATLMPRHYKSTVAELTGEALGCK